MSEFTVAGLVATTPRHVITADNMLITSFRLASTTRKFDESQNMWVDGMTNWFTITAYKGLAITVNESIKKGERIFVSGRLVVRDWDNGERTGTSVEIEADAIGHDLSWGTSVFNRTVLVRDADPVVVPEVAPEPAKPAHECDCDRCYR